MTSTTSIPIRPQVPGPSADPFTKQFKWDANGMAYSSQDTAALNAAREAGFNPLMDETDDIDRYVDHFQCPDAPLCHEPAKVLAAAIEAAHRFIENNTVWLDIQNAETIPEYVYQAIASMDSFGTAIVVTQGRHCTHGPDATLLDSRLQELIYAANDSGYVWHPIAEKHVYTARYPHQAQHR